MNRSSSVKITVNGVYFLIKACALFYICMLVGNIVLKQPAYLSRSLSLSSTPISQSSLSNALFTTKAQHILKCSTSKGSFSVQLYPEICPNSVKQLTSLVNTSFLDQGIAFWRVNQWITQVFKHPHFNLIYDINSKITTFIRYTLFSYLTYVINSLERTNPRQLERYVLNKDSIITHLQTTD